VTARDAAASVGDADAVLLDALSAELIALYGSTRALVAVDAADDRAALAFARSWRASLSGLGHRSAVLRAGALEDAEEFRVSVVRPYRAGRTPEGDAAPAVEPGWDAVGAAPDAAAVLLVAGGRLLRPALRDLWHYSVRLDTPGDASPGPEERAYAAASEPRRAASAVVDATTAATPRRLYLDAC